MRYRTRRRVQQLALVTIAAPATAWALEQAAGRAEARDQTSLAGRRLRQGADLVQRFGRGPLADRLSRRPRTTVTQETGNRGTRSPWWLAGGPSVGSGCSVAVCLFP
jgi:hypothetical protein